MRNGFFKFLFVPLVVLLVTPMSEGYAQSPKASYRTSPMNLAGGSRLMLVSPNEWFPLAEKLSRYLEETHDQFAKLYGQIPAFETTLKLMDATTFYNETGAPTWTNAMYYRGEITIPLTLEDSIQIEDLYRSVRHEYTHAIINSLSAGRCPGWLDEGLAQWSEGSINPSLEPSLRKWLYFNNPVPLELLQGGFTKLEARMVPPAYAQSLFAAKTVIHSFGFKQIRNFFKALRDGDQKKEAFEKSFDMSESGFESALGKSLKRWAYSTEKIVINWDEHTHH